MNLIHGLKVVMGNVRQRPITEGSVKRNYNEETLRGDSRVLTKSVGKKRYCRVWTRRGGLMNYESRVFDTLVNPVCNVDRANDKLRVGDRLIGRVSSVS